MSQRHSSLLPARSVFFGLICLVLGWALAAPVMAEGNTATTLDNLMTAFNGESNARTRYLAFALKADEEGYAPVASLFRAAARAEEVHAAGHAEVIRKMGGTPKADVKKPEVNSTKENLESALKGETYERDVMYPDFLKLAHADKNKDAVRTFVYAKTAEGEHVKLYTEALNNLAAWKSKEKKDFFVCTVCGFTVTAITFDHCPSCYNPVSKYVKVN